jgi:hypothetical protein
MLLNSLLESHLRYEELYQLLLNTRVPSFFKEISLFYLYKNEWLIYKGVTSHDLTSFECTMEGSEVLGTCYFYPRSLQRGHTFVPSFYSSEQVQLTRASTENWDVWRIYTGNILLAFIIVGQVHVTTAYVELYTVLCNRLFLTLSRKFHILMPDYRWQLKNFDLSHNAEWSCVRN